MYEYMFQDSYLDCNAKTYTRLITTKEKDYKEGNNIILFATKEDLRSNDAETEIHTPYDPLD